MDEQVMRVPPNNADAEKSVLGCMMQDREALSMAFELLTADDFYQPANREVFDAMHQLNTQGMPIDLVTVDDELTRRGTLEGVGGTSYLVELSQCRPIEERYRKLLVHALRAESIYAEQFFYIAGREEDTRAMSVILHTDQKGGCRASQVANMLSVLLDRQLQVSAASPYMVDREPKSFVFVEEPRFVALTGFCKVTKENETVSGDHYSILESEKGRLSLILSDGTGSGEQASRDSEKVVDLMEKLLEAGYEREAAVDMVNVAVFAGGREYSHPTLDICDLDLYNGRCHFCKVGGAASFVKRGKKVEAVSQGNLPLGIFRNIEVNTMERRLQNGDYVILLTDGVLDALGPDDCEEVLSGVIGDMEDVCPGELAEKLVEAALVSCGGHIQDDMTVLVAGIWENSAV